MIDDGAADTLKDAPQLPADAVAVKLAGLPLNPAALAVTTYGWVVAPSVHDVSDAIPAAFVATKATEDPELDAPATCAPGVTTANVTATFATGLPDASVTRTDGGTATGVATGATWLLPAITAICVAAPRRSRGSPRAARRSRAQ